MDIERFAAFSREGSGGNPAGVVLCEAMPSDAVMQAIAKDVGYSETVFAVRSGAAWRVRYFAPESEIHFCGHATIALGAALARHEGSGQFSLILNGGAITVDGDTTRGHPTAAFHSPPTRQRLCSAAFMQEALALFGLGDDDLDPRLPAAIIHAGADHLLIALKERSRLAVMDYDLDWGRRLMTTAGLATVCLIHAESAEHFHARNAFAAGGVYEDPATGAAAAALGGYLTAIGWPSRAFRVVQGEDMGIPCVLYVDGPDRVGDGARVSGEVRPIT